MRPKKPTIAELQSRLDSAAVELKMLHDERRLAGSNAALRQFCEAVEGSQLPQEAIVAAVAVRSTVMVLSQFPMAQLREVAAIIRRRVPL